MARHKRRKKKLAKGELCQPGHHEMKPVHCFLKGCRKCIRCGLDLHEQDCPGI